MIRLAVLALILLLMTGCTRSSLPPRSEPVSAPDPAPAAASAPEKMQTCVDRNTRPFIVAGIEVGKPSAGVRERMGTASSVERSPRYGDSQYHYPFGTLHVLGDGTIYSITLTADAPTGELFPGIRMGAQRASVLTYLDAEGYCGIPQPNGTDVSFTHATGSPQLMLIFSTDGSLRQVVLRMTGE